MNKNQPRITNPLWQKYRHWLYVLVLPIYLALFFIEEHFIDGSVDYLVSYVPFDDHIPFCEYFYIAYVLWYPFMFAVGLYLGIKEPQNFKRYMTYIGASFFTAVLLFALFPNGQDLRVDIDTLGRDNIFTRAIAVLYATDTNTNVCPSLHVVGSMAAVFGVLHSRRLRRTWILPILSILLAVCIILSTVFIKQHSVLDVYVGIPYGFVFYGLVYQLPDTLRKWTRKPVATPITAEKSQ